MSTTHSLSSLLASINPNNESLAELLGETAASTSSSNSTTANAAIQDAVDAILNSATNTSGGGIDVTSTVDAILEIDSAPEISLQNQVTADNSETSALTTIEKDLTSLQTAVEALTDPSGAFSDVTVSSSNNDVVSATAASGVIPGVTLTLSGTSYTPVTLVVQTDLTNVSTAINNFVTAWNQVMSDINTQETYSSTGTEPALLGDPSLDVLQAQLLDGIATNLSGNNGLVNFQSIGIQLQDNGTLSVVSSSSTDSMDLNDALANDFSSVQNLFQSSTGVGQTLQTALTALTNSVSGPLNSDMSGISSEVTDLNSQISDFQAQLQQTQTQLTTEYSNINTTLEQLPETLASINSQIDALNPQNTQ